MGLCVTLFLTDNIFQDFERVLKFNFVNNGRLKNNLVFFFSSNKDCNVFLYCSNFKLLWNRIRYFNGFVGILVQDIRLPTIDG